MTITLDEIEGAANEYLVPIGLKILLALAIFVFGRIISRALLRAVDRVLERSKIDISLRKFLGDVVYATLLVAVVIAAMDTVGIKTTAIVAVLGAAGLAVGLALQGSLSNFAAGVMLIVLRPYKVTDLVMIGKYLGRVDAIKVFHTILITADNREITIPNGQVIAAPIENYTVLGRRRVDLLVAVQAALTGDDRIATSPAAAIDVAEVADTGIKLYVRPWTTSDNYSKVAADTMEKIKDALLGATMQFSVVLQPGA
jgi:small conductance mechanosensitive channel